MNPKSWKAAFASVALALLTSCAPAERKTVTVFAAASLTDALTEIAETYEAEKGADVRLSFAASGAVARQIEAGAPADVVILADAAWMERLSTKNRLGPQRADLLRNRLVVVAPSAAEVGPDPFATLAAEARLAIGDPESVPAGAYARTWLQTTGRWDAVEDQLVFATDVRGVRAFVARGEAALGIVYRTDAIGQSDIRIVLQPPPAEQPAILYPAAGVAGAGPAGRAFFDYLTGPEAGAIFRRYGFEPLT